MLLVVGRVGRAHGVRGDVFVDPMTDEPDVRFADGAVVATGTGGQLQVASRKWHSGRLLVRFVGIGDRTAAEALRGTALSVDVDPMARPADPDEYYDHQLTGLRVVLADGTVVGEVSQVLHLPAQDVLAVQTAKGAEVLIPFVNEIVPTVDLVAGTVLVTPPAGLLDLADVAEAGHE